MKTGYAAVVMLSGQCGPPDSADLLAPFQPQIEHLATLAAAPDRHFRVYYFPVLARLAACLQASEPPAPGADAACRFSCRLTAARHSLIRRQGYLLPAGAEPETVAAQADVWTYAIATASLLRGLGPALLTGQATSPPFPRDPTLLLISHLLPVPGRTWLWQYPGVLAAWLAVLRGDAADSGLATVLNGTSPGVPVHDRILP